MSTGVRVAAVRAWVAVRPARVNSTSSSWRLAPWATPGFVASVPAIRGTPALLFTDGLRELIKVAVHGCLVGGTVDRREGSCHVVKVGPELGVVAHSWAP